MKSEEQDILNKYSSSNSKLPLQQRIRKVMDWVANIKEPKEKYGPYGNQKGDSNITENYYPGSLDGLFTKKVLKVIINCMELSIGHLKYSDKQIFLHSELRRLKNTKPGDSFPSISDEYHSLEGFNFQTINDSVKSKNVGKQFFDKSIGSLDGLFTKEILILFSNYLEKVIQDLHDQLKYLKSEPSDDWDYYAPVEDINQYFDSDKEIYHESLVKEFINYLNFELTRIRNTKPGDPHLIISDISNNTSLGNFEGFI